MSENSQQVGEGQVDRQLRDPSSVSPETEAVRPFQVRRKGFPGMSFSNHHRLRKRCPQLRSQTSLSKLHSLRCWPTAMPRKQKEGLPILNLPGTRYPKQAKAGSVLAPQEFLGPGGSQYPMNVIMGNEQKCHKGKAEGWGGVGHRSCTQEQHRGSRLNQVQAFKHQMALKSKAGFGPTESKQSFS